MSTKDKTIFHEFNPVIYPLKLWISKHPVEEHIHERFEETNGKRLNIGGPGGIASTYDREVVQKSNSDYGVLITINRDLEISNIAHEATHAAYVIWNFIGEEKIGMEADAYLTGWIADCINQVDKNQFKDELNNKQKRPGTSQGERERAK
jgi:hypothetical protein